MNIHKNARLSLARRIEMVQEMTLNGLSACAAASAYGVTPPTVRKWLGRYLALAQLDCSTLRLAQHARPAPLRPPRLRPS